MIFDFLKKKKAPKDAQPDDSTDSPVLDTPEEEEIAQERKQGWFQKIRDGLSQTREKVKGRIETIKAARRGVDEDFYDEILEILLETDMGMDVADEMVGKLRREVGARGAENTDEACDLLAEVIGRDLASPLKTLDPAELESSPGDNSELTVILLTGVNGSGKTTVCGKLAKRYTQAGYKVLLIGADTFRAAAIDQLRVWAERSETDFLETKEGADPASVVYDGLTRASREGHEVVIVDTAGRLQNKVNLMNELGKIRRTVDKLVSSDRIQSLLVVDSTTGQNAISQAEIFGEVASLDGLILTKLDGTARGGVVIAINNKMELPVLEIGVGEGIDDLVPFDASTYARSLLGDIAEDDINYRWRVGTID